MKMPEFIKIMNLAKVYFPVLNEVDEEVEAERQLRTMEIVMQSEGMSCNLENFFTLLRRYLIDDRTFLLSFFDFTSLLTVLILNYIHTKKRIVHEKFRQFD
mmetsp:Transcript_33131/g.24369  ORF Transcript_33131/g.24369 Transcript_33131/m.24369 type:complete len:101 (-) Transcript_33131:219-521(-)